ncbi:MAG TPA: GNAT family N-acetyltransferase, partial [Chloroflexota bacterium]
MFDDGTPRALGDGLRLRWSQPADTEAIVALTCAVFRDADEDPASEQMAAYTRQLMSGNHPLMTPQDFAVVEDSQAGKIVACSCLLQQTWQFGEVTFPVGRPELVATDPTYRKRGLIRAIFAALHARSDARGDLAQGITGIRYFYRQFGYEYALELGGGRTTYFSDIPAAQPDTREPYRLRPAGNADVPFIAELYQRSQARSLISTVISLANWRTKILAPVASDNDWLVQTVEDTAGTPAGYVVLAPIRFQSTIVVRQIEVKAGIALHAVALPLLRALRGLAPKVRTAKPLDPPTGVGFALGSAHPWYDAVGNNLLPRRWSPYAWYVRIADLPSFIRC